MSDYERTTRACLVNQLHPELRQAVQNYFQEHELGDPETGTVSCCETLSTRKSGGVLAAWLDAAQDSTIHTGMLLTSEWLIWVRYGDKTGVLLTAANLGAISVKAYSSLFSPDTGLEVTGFIQNAKGAMQGYIGMGPEPAAQKFCEEVEQAVLKLNPPRPSKWPKWMGR